MYFDGKKLMDLKGKRTSGKCLSTTSLPVTRLFSRPFYQYFENISTIMPSFWKNADVF